MKAKNEVLTQEEINRDLNLEALEKLTGAVKEYEATTGNRVTGMNIASRGDQYPEDQQYQDDECCGCHECEGHRLPEMMEPCNLKEYINTKIVNPILTAFPISTPNVQQCDAEQEIMRPNMFDTFSECRYHDDMIAYAVGQIAYATTAMLLEYQTQKMAQVEMCRIVDKSGPSCTTPDGVKVTRF